MVIASNASATAINSSSKGYISAFQSGRIAAPIPVLVMVTHNGCNFSQQGMLCEHVGTDVRMAAYRLPFCLGEAPLLTEDIVADPNHSEIVHRSGGT